MSEEGTETPLPDYGDYRVDHYFREEFSETIKNRRFRIGVFRTGFILRNLDDAPNSDADALLAAILWHMVERAERNSGTKPDRFSVIFRSEALEKPIQIPYAGFEQNNIEAIMNEFEKVEQSLRRKGMPSMFETPLNLEIVMGPSRDEVKELLSGNSTGWTRVGSGKCREVRHNVDRSNLIEVKNREARYCLFLAVQLAIKYAEMDKSSSTARSEFSRLVNRPSFANKRLQLIRSLMGDMRRLGLVVPELTAYEAELHGDLLQQYLDRKYGEGHFRLAIFGEWGRYKPLYKGAKRARFDLPLYLERGHYFAIRSISTFFSRTNYCLDCERPYQKAQKHTVRCKAKCTRCCGIGYGYPCEKDADGYNEECAACHKLFHNRRCYQAHLEKHLCQLYRHCKKCGQDYRVVAVAANRAARGDTESSDDEDDEEEEEEGIVEAATAEAAPAAEDGHVCHYKWCAKCMAKHARNEPCFVQCIVPSPPKPYKIIVYDFESHQIPVKEVTLPDWAEMLEQSGQRRYLRSEHNVMCVSALLLCSKCILDESCWRAETTGDCQTCGPNRRRMNTWVSGGNEADPDPDPDPLHAFVYWLFYGLVQNGSREERIYAFAHYSGRYDLHLLLGEIYKFGGLTPRITRSGNKLYEVCFHWKPHICPFVSFRDTWNWLSMPLAKLPAALGLPASVGQKEFFPHRWNLPENMHHQLDTLPPREYYAPEEMEDRRREQFLQWYEREWNRQPFCLAKDVQPYCEQDVWLLTGVLARLQQLFFEMATRQEWRDDCLVNSITLASACIRHFIINYMEEGSIAIIPEQGYHRGDKQSAEALRFLRFYAAEHHLLLQHRDSPEGEYRLRLSGGKTLHLDGFCRREPPERPLCIEYNGCSWHGHGCLYEPEEIALNGITSAKNLEAVEARRRCIEEAGIEYRLFWACEVDEWLAIEAEPDQLTLYHSITEVVGPLLPRDAFFGGRTQPLALRADLEEVHPQASTAFSISLFDVVSLYDWTGPLKINCTHSYPSCTYFGHFPLGHPRLHTQAPHERQVLWTVPGDNPWRGLLQVHVLPPSDLFMPVLPERVHGKLFFHLCNACAMDAPKKAHRLRLPYTEALGRQLCQHGDEQRGFLCVTTHVELNKALAMGYRVTRFYAAYHWERWSQDLFRGYVRQMMKMKIEASGWPEICTNPFDEEDQARKRREFIEEYERRYQIHLDPERMELNEGRRYMAKICNNSLWGRWALRSNLTKDLITDSPVELHRVLNDPKLEIGAPCPLNDVLFSVPYQHRREFVQSHHKANIVLALFTTSYARLALYEVMEAVQNAPGYKALYTDTDSMLLLHPSGAKMPFPVGNFLGEMAREYGGEMIRAYYSGGCKQYILRLLRRGVWTHSRDIQKFRGCTLDTANRHLFDFDAFKAMIKRYGLEQEPLVLLRDSFIPDWRRGNVQTKTSRRTYRPIFDKGWVDERLDVLPYGYRGPMPKNPIDEFLSDRLSVEGSGSSSSVAEGMPEDDVDP